MSTSSGSTRFPSSFNGAYNGLKANRQYYVGARAGVDLTPGIAAYAKAGYTSLHTKAFTSSGSLAELKDNAGGFRYGAGVEAQLAGPVAGRVEYRRSHYKNVNAGRRRDHQPGGRRAGGAVLKVRAGAASERVRPLLD